MYLLTLLDALESGQYKYALQVCNKALKKTKVQGDISQLMVYTPLIDELGTVEHVGVQSFSISVPREWER